METFKTPLLKMRVGSSLTYSWNILWDKFITLFLIGLIIIVAQMPMSAAHGHDPSGFAETIFGVFSFLFMIFIVYPFKISADYLYLKAIRKVDFEVKEIFDVFKNYLNVVLASLLSIAIVAIGFIFFLIPGIIFACRLAFVPYLVMDKKLDAVKAVEESWRLTRGYGWRIFWMYIVSFFLIIAGIIVLFFGVIIALMWIKLAFAGLYQAVLEEKGEYIPATEDLTNIDPEAIKSEAVVKTENTEPVNKNSNEGEVKDIPEAQE